MTAQPDIQSTQPVCGLSDVEVGDVLLFSGPDHVSRLARRVLGGSFDHAGLVIDVSKTGNMRSGIEVADLMFTGSQTFDLADYEFRPESMLVRRHRIPGGKAEIADRAREAANSRMEYSHAKMLGVMMASMVRSSDGIYGLSDVQAYEFVCNLGSTFNEAARQLHTAGIGVCVDAVRSSFDTTVGSHIDAPYYGIVAPQFPTGLLAWVASGKRLREWLTMVAAKGDPLAGRRVGRTPTPPSVGFRDELDALRVSLGLSGRPLVQTYDEMESSRQVVTSSIGVAEFAGVEVPDGITAAEVPDMDADFLSTLAWWLLDAFLRYGVPLGPEHLEVSPSLFDVGRLDLDGVAWTEPGMQRRTARRIRGQEAP